MTIARKCLWGRFFSPGFLNCGYCYLVFPELINCNKNASWSVPLYSDRTFQVANRKSFLRLRLVFTVLICPISSSFSFVISVFPWTGWWSPLRHPVIPLQSAASLRSDAVCSRSAGDQKLLFPFPSF
jgi:hypothetical protein